MARDIAKTEAYTVSRRQRKKVEMLFAHLNKRILLPRPVAITWLTWRPRRVPTSRHSPKPCRKLAKLIPVPQTAMAI